MNDNLFLLSVDEYNKYENRIPYIACWWWLRSPGTYQYRAAIVSDNGGLYDGGDGVYDYAVAVRPALRIGNLKSSNLQIGSKFIRFGFSWTVIDDNLAICDIPIAFNEFDAKSNDYESSEVRKFLLDWYEHNGYDETSI